VLADTIINPIGVITFDYVLVTLWRMFGSTSKTRTPNNLLGATTMMYQAPLFLLKHLLFSIPNQ
jgi:hypothetical protein